MEPFVTPAHEEHRRAVREFAEAEIAPIAQALDRTCTFPWENVRKMADLGWFGMTVPERFGGLGQDYLSYIITIEELARVDASHAITVSAHSTLGTSPIVAFGTDAQKEKYLPILAAGRVLGGFGLTEPGAGSDAGASRTMAVRADGGYRLDGSKIFITHAGVGEIFVVTAVTARHLGTRGISGFIVTKENVDRPTADRAGIGHAPELEPFTPGVRAGKKEDKMGWRASDTRELILDGAWVPEENRLGEEGQGFINFMKTLDAGRIGLGALALGIARGAFEHLLEFSGRHRRAGESAEPTQGLQFALADMATGIAAARHLVYHAAWLFQHGRPHTREAAMAKLFASELAMRVTTRAVQLHGGSGYTDAHPIERMMRDAKICEIGEGTSEIQRLVIARNLIRAADGAGA